MAAVEPTARPPLEIGVRGLTLDSYLQVTDEGRQVAFAEKAVERMEGSRRSLLRQLSAGVRIYGVNTMYGAESATEVTPELIEEFQRNTLSSHAMGTGDRLGPRVVRGMLLLKANSLAQGFSGVRPELVRMLIAFLNADILPVVPEQGSLGASGDLIPSAHMGQALMGEGEVTYRGGVMSARAALAEAGLSELMPVEKEGLSLVNGTSFSAAFAAHNTANGTRLLQAADIAAAVTIQALRGWLTPFDDRLLSRRPFAGAAAAARNVRRLCEGAGERASPGRPMHDAYSIRCIPQVHGASRDAFAYVRAAVVTELNAVTDNPLIFEDDDSCVSGGNFHAQPIALPMDTLAVLIAELATLSQRRTEQLVNPPHGAGLPTKLTARGSASLGLIMLSTSAMALTAENRSLCAPASVDAMIVDEVEDHVSMASLAARKASQVLMNTARVLAIELIGNSQALELRDGDRVTPVAASVREFVRVRAPFVREDQGLSQAIEMLALDVLEGGLSAAVEHVIGSPLD